MTTKSLTVGALGRLSARPLPERWGGPARLAVAAAVALALFALLLLLDGRDPLAAFRLIWDGSLGQTYGRNEVLVKLIPLSLCAVAVAIPARVGLINVGGEGQLHIGALLATWAILYNGLPGWLLLPAALIAGAVGGALWAGLAALLRVRGNVNEAISTLLLNYVAILLVNYFVYGPWRDRSTFNWPYSKVFPDSATLPVLFGNRVHAGLLLVPIALAALFLVLRYTRVGFAMRAVGGNAEAARRSGIGVGRYLFWSLVAGGAIAGLAGMIEICGVQGRLRPGISVQFGFIGFLASWLGGHRAGGILFASLLFSAIAVGGDNLQIGASLPASTVNILMALMLFAVLAGRRAQRVGG